MKINTVGLVAGLAVASAASSAFAFVPWNNAYSTNGVGGNSVISWTGGGSDNGLFGAPTVAADTFFFQANSNFDALASNGGSVITADTLRVTVTAAPGNYFTEVLYFSSGDYQLFGDGASVNVTGSMTVTDALNNSRTDTQPFVTNPAFPIVGNNTEITQGNWSGFAVIDVASFLGGPVTAIDLVFSNSLIAITAPGSNASIVTLPNTQGSFSLQVIPAPASAFALLGLGLVARRRR